MRIIVNPHKIELVKEEAINEKEIDISRCYFEFNEIPDDYVKEAYFTFKDNSYKVILENNECSIPNEVLIEKGDVELGVVAYKVENEEEIKRYNPSPVYFNTLVGSLKDAENTEPITPTDKEQMEQAIQNMEVQINNLDIDAEKVDTTTTITITKKDGTTKEVEILDGEKGDKGDKGNTGDKGDKGDTGEKGETGATGNGIESVEKTSTIGKVDTYTMTFTDGESFNYDVTNGEVTQSQLDEVKRELDSYKTIYNALPKIEGEGEAVTLDNTANSLMKLKLKGNTSQYTTTGKNKWSLGEVAIIGWAQSSNDLKALLNTLVAGSYTLSMKFKVDSVKQQEPNNLYGFVFTTSNSFTYQKRENASSISVGQELNYQFTINIREQDAGNFTNCYLYGFGNDTNGRTGNSIIKEAQLESGSSATDFEPYTNGASPNPSYPQPINVVSGDNEVVVCGKNLFNQETFLEATGISYNGEYYVGTIPTWVNDYPSTNPLKSDFKENTQYTISLTTYLGGSGTAYVRFNYTDNTNSLITISNTTATRKIATSTSGKSVKSVSLSFYSGNDNWYIKDFEILEGVFTSETIGDFIPYQSQTYPIYLGVENLLSTNDTTFEQYEDISINTIPAGTYTFKGNIVTSDTDSDKCYIRLLKNDTVVYDWSSNRGDFTKEITLNDEINKIALYAGSNFASGEGDTATYSNMMISVKPSANYYPYGTQSIELCKIGDYQDYFTKNSGKNKFDGEYKHLALWSTTQGADTTFAGGSDNYVGAYCRVEEGKTYSISRLKETNRFSVSFSVNEPIVDGATKVYNTGSGKKIENITIPSGYNYLFVYLSNTGENTDDIGLMINEGSTALPYEPYGTGQWCKYNAIGKVVLNGSESWQYASQGFFYYLNDSVKTATSGTTIEIYANKYLGDTYNHVFGNSSNNIISTHTSSGRICIRDSRFTTTSAFKTELQNNNVIAYIILATPYLSLIEDTTLISQLDNIQNAMSYEGQTNISQTNNDEAMRINAVALRDLSNIGE